MKWMRQKVVERVREPFSSSKTIENFLKENKPKAGEDVINNF